jgi:ribokinase
MPKKYDVICVGAALVDMVAQVERHPLEDDEVFVSELNILSGGAAANTSVACSKLGLNTAFIGKLGLDDEFGAKIIKDFETESVSIEYIKYSKAYKTGSAYVALNSAGDRRIYAHSGAANYLSSSDIKENEINNANILYLSSLKNIEPFIKACKFAKDFSIPIILNPGMLIIEQGFEHIKSLLQKIDILILSENEFRSLLAINGEVNFKKDHYETSCEILKELGIEIIVITLGKRGALLISHKDSQIVNPIENVSVVDTTGAGDAFSAGFIYKFHKKKRLQFKNLIRCVEIGNFVAGKCIQKLGARYGIPLLNEVKQFENSINNKI